jgi:hypothetical protein
MRPAPGPGPNMLATFAATVAGFLGDPSGPGLSSCSRPQPGPRRFRNGGAAGRRSRRAGAVSCPPGGRIHPCTRASSRTRSRGRSCFPYRDLLADPATRTPVPAASPPGPAGDDAPDPRPRPPARAWHPEPLRFACRVSFRPHPHILSFHAATGTPGPAPDRPESVRPDKRRHWQLEDIPVGHPSLRLPNREASGPRCRPWGLADGPMLAGALSGPACAHLSRGVGSWSPPGRARLARGLSA